MQPRRFGFSVPRPPSTPTGSSVPSASRSAISTRISGLEAVVVGQIGDGPDAERPRRSLDEETVRLVAVDTGQPLVGQCLLGHRVSPLESLAARRDHLTPGEEQFDGELGLAPVPPRPATAARTLLEFADQLRPTVGELGRTRLMAWAAASARPSRR